MYLVIYDSGKVSLEHLLLSRHPSKQKLLHICFKIALLFLACFIRVASFVGRKQILKYSKAEQGHGQIKVVAMAWVRQNGRSSSINSEISYSAG